MGAEQKRKTTVKTNVLNKEVGKKAITVKIPDVGEVTDKIEVALDEAERATEAVEVATKKTKIIKVCSVCGDETCNVPDKSPREVHWVDKKVPK